MSRSQSTPVKSVTKKAVRPAASVKKTAKLPAKKPAKQKQAPARSTTAASDRYVIIMAGGRGERFWPVSREATPKQLITLLGDRSFLQQAVDRVRPLVPAENILVITNAVQAASVRRQLPELPAANIIAEPVGRDTCAAVTLGAAIVGARSTTATMAVLPADHVIPDPVHFRRVLGDAMDLASRGQVIVTLGIKATGPETGYGYIRHDLTELPPPAGVRPYKTRFYRAEQFVEKPDHARALEYVNAGNYRWNAGMFVWSFVTLTNALEAHQPEMNAACHRWFAAAAQGGKSLDRILAREYPEIRKISVDYALMERAHNVVVADGDFDWDDLGAWPALARHIRQDAEGNAAVGRLIHVDSARNVVYDARTRHRSPVTLVGVKDCIIVLADDATLVASKGESQKIKELVRKLAADPDLKKLV